MRFLVLTLLLVLPGLAAAWQPDGEEVDLELVLAVDVSRSMSPEELEIQRRGYAEALTSDEVVAAITGGMIGRIALSYVEWAGQYSQRSAVDWTLIAGPEDAAGFAARIVAQPGAGMRRTSISGALLYAAESFEDNGFSGLRRVIDISGDGPNNHGRPVVMARDAVLARGITINGLPLMTAEEQLAVWDIPNLDAYYADCVIGGPGAFVLPVRGWAQFPDAVRRKLVLEIAGDGPDTRTARPGAPPTPGARLWQAQAGGAAPVDCMIGEKTWERYRRYWGEP
jgi:hypothetical protein